MHYLKILVNKVKLIIDVYNDIFMWLLSEHGNIVPIILVYRYKTWNEDLPRKGDKEDHQIVV